MTSKLYKQSIEIILKNQGREGGYLASPSFEPYQYCWFRDSSYIAYAMDLAGQHQSAVRFYNWSANTLNRYSAKLAACINKKQRGETLVKEDFFHCRFHLSGVETPGNWGNHQLDSLGVWLWAYCRHLELNGKKSAAVINQEILFLVRDYLAALWRYPCFDCWEENGEDIHTYTLAAIHAGLASLGKLLEDEESTRISNEIKSYLLIDLVHGGIFKKSQKKNIVDASLISIAVPFSILPADDLLVKQTIDVIVRDLGYRNVGLHRFHGDVYYGGGIWILLSAWLGWYYSESGRTSQALDILRWITAQAAEDGGLPEQLCEDLYSQKECKQWRLKWNEPANPLLWSHAMYILLYLSLEKSGAL
ncbi:MAG: glycoside hydrolase [Anaerolineae bacterium]|nr:glycoside hydrolase [Anaerolineae bacterium]